METIDLSDFFSGGYFLIRAGRPDWPLPFGEFLPKGDLISLSACICQKRLSVLWGWNPGNRDAALKFGIPEARLSEFLNWCQIDQALMDLPCMFHSSDAARAFVSRFELNTDNLFLIGAGLPKLIQKAWIDEEKEDEGIVGRIKQGEALEAGGEMLGYDIISYGGYKDFSHSWLCSGLEQEMYERYGIRSNKHGLIDSFVDAKKINDWIAEDGQWGLRAEPEPYDFWLLLSYPLEAKKSLPIISTINS